MALITLANTDIVRTYTLDGLGNWQRTQYAPVSGSDTLDKRQHNYVNEITLRKVGAGTPANFIYDANGNVLFDGVHTCQYDAFNRLAQVTTGSNLGKYNYDALNRRSRRDMTIVSTTTHEEYLYQGWQCMEVRDGSNTLLTQYAWGQYLDELILQKNYVAINGFPSGAKVYPMQDLLFRTNALSDSTGVVVEAYDTDAYGNTLIYRNSGSSIDWMTDSAVTVPTCAFIFTGQRYDFESGLYYYKNRYYSPGLGRFLTRDPIGNWESSFAFPINQRYTTQPRFNSLNCYEYANTNPVEYCDVYGLETTHCIKWASCSMVVGCGAAFTILSCTDTCDNSAGILYAIGRYGLEGLGGIGGTIDYPDCLSAFIATLGKANVRSTQNYQGAYLLGGSTDNNFATFTGGLGASGGLSSLSNYLWNSPGKLCPCTPSTSGSSSQSYPRQCKKAREKDGSAVNVYDEP